MRSLGNYLAIGSHNTTIGIINENDMGQIDWRLEWFASGQRQSLTILARTSGIFTFLGALYILYDLKFVGCSCARNRNGTTTTTRRRKGIWCCHHESSDRNEQQAEQTEHQDENENVQQGQRGNPTKNKVLAVMSFCDLIFAFIGPILGTVMVPSEILYDTPSTSSFFGTQTSCTIQGALNLGAGAVSAFLNAALAICYILLVKYQLSEEQMKRIEPFALGIPLVLGILTTAPGLFCEGFNFNGMWACGATPSPWGCNWFVETDGEECIQICSEQMLFSTHRIWYLSFLVLTVSIISVCMFLLYRTVLEQESSSRLRRSQARPDTLQNSIDMCSSIDTSSQQNESKDDNDSSSLDSDNQDNYHGTCPQHPGLSPHTISDVQRSSSQDDERQKYPLARAMRQQGLLYSMAFFACFFPSALYLNGKRSSFGLQVAVAISVNLIGFTNFLVYIRPRYLHFRREFPEQDIGSIFLHTLCRTNPYPLRQRPEENADESGPYVYTTTPSPREWVSSLTMRSYLGADKMNVEAQESYDVEISKQPTVCPSG